jgi:hypothetical protein
MPPFEADSTGKQDATLQLQSAIDFARHNYMEVYLPAGQYIVTDSLNLTQYPRMTSGGFAQFNGSSNYCWSRFSTWSIRGQSARCDALSCERNLPLKLGFRTSRTMLEAMPSGYVLNEDVDSVPCFSGVPTLSVCHPNCFCNILGLMPS